MCVCVFWTYWLQKNRISIDVFLILYAFDVSWPFNRQRRLLEDIIEEICDTIVVRNCEYDLHAGEACEGMGESYGKLKTKTCRGWGGNSTLAALYLPRLEVKGQRWWLRVIFQWESVLLKFQWHPTNGVKFLPICNELVVREGTVWISKQLTYVDCLFLLFLFNNKHKLNDQKCRLTVQWFGIFSLMLACMNTSMTCSY